jgi:hypothetical protein
MSIPVGWSSGYDNWKTATPPEYEQEDGPRRHHLACSRCGEESYFDEGSQEPLVCAHCVWIAKHPPPCDCSFCRLERELVRKWYEPETGGERAKKDEAAE